MSNGKEQERLSFEFEGRSFTTDGHRIYEGDHVHSCGFYERALIHCLKQILLKPVSEGKEQER